MLLLIFRPIGWVFHLLFAIAQLLFYPVVVLFAFLIDFDLLNQVNFKDYMQYDRETESVTKLRKYHSRLHFLFGRKPFKTIYREPDVYWP